MADVPPQASPDEFAGWLAPHDAVARLSHLQERDARGVILQGARHGVVRAAARSTSYLIAGNPRQGPTDSSVVPQTAWLNVDHSWFIRSTFWQSGQFEVDTQIADAHGFGTVTVTAAYFGVRFDPVTIDAIPRPTAQPQPAPVATIAADRGGRPRKSYWDDLWVEICRQIYVGDLKPADSDDFGRAFRSDVGHRFRLTSAGHSDRSRPGGERPTTFRFARARDAVKPGSRGNRVSVR